MELKCAVQNYGWGKKGKASSVANMVKSADPEFTVNEDEAYAELWMGTHQNGPSVLKADGTLLKDYIDKNRHVLGSNVNEEEFEGLPFLFKLLSVGKALSIQVHPDKKSAERLHNEKPDIYKDPNHKPEVAIAITPFEAFCGFRPETELRSYIELLPELQAVVGEWSRFYAEDTNTAIKKCFETMLSQKPEVIAEQLISLINRLSLHRDTYREKVDVSLLERLHKDFPGDVGCFGYFFFNHMKLQPGETIYIEPNEPHAYLFGDCIECMACSDNVVRAGLTPKQKDIPTLIEMLKYIWEPASSKKMQPDREDECTVVFRPPVRDFAIAKININPERDSYELIPRSTASILLITSGKAEIAPSKTLNHGSALFIPANDKINLKVLDEEIIMFQAFVNV